MATLQTTPAGASQAPNGVQPAGVPGSVPLQSGDKESIRAKWREKWRKRKERKQAVANGEPAPPPGPDTPPVPPMAGAPGTPAVSPGPVPWTADTVRPALKQLIPVVEKWDVNSLKELALKVSPEALTVVSKYGGWSEPAKVTIENSGSEVVAKWMNRFGVSSENAHEFFLLIASGSVWAGHQSVKSELLKLQADLKAEKLKGKNETVKN